MYNSYKIKKNESHQFIGDVYYIITIKKNNILSLRQLLKKDYENKMKDCTLTLLNTHRVMIAKVTMKKNIMFLLNIETYVPKYVKTCVKYETWFGIWDLSM